MDEVQDDRSLSWRKRKKHFFILSNSGKPIYSRYASNIYCHLGINIYYKEYSLWIMHILVIFGLYEYPLKDTPYIHRCKIVIHILLQVPILASSYSEMCIRMIHFKKF